MRFFTDSDKKKAAFKILPGVITVLIIVMAAVFIAVRIHLPRPASVKEYHSDVAQEDCLLCGDANICRDADMVAVIVLNNQSFSQFNAGLKRYCTAGSLLEEGCDLLQLRDEGLSESELRHKYAPYDINGIYRLHPGWKFHSSLFSRAGDRNGTSGAIHSYESNRIIYGRLDISSTGQADAEFLSTRFCQKCFDKIYPATRAANCFLYDYQTGTVYPLTDGPDSFEIRQYSVDLIYRTAQNIVFIIRQEDASDAP